VSVGVGAFVNDFVAAPDPPSTCSVTDVEVVVVDEEDGAKEFEFPRLAEAKKLASDVCLNSSHNEADIRGGCFRPSSNFMAS
jgi:hypothetical protein